MPDEVPAMPELDVQPPPGAPADVARGPGEVERAPFEALDPPLPGHHAGLLRLQVDVLRIDRLVLIERRAETE